MTTEELLSPGMRLCTHSVSEALSRLLALRAKANRNSLPLMMDLQVPLMQFVEAREVAHELNGPLPPQLNVRVVTHLEQDAWVLHDPDGFCVKSPGVTL